MHHFHLVTLLGLTWPWPWPLFTIRPLPMHYLFLTLRSVLAKFGFAAVISPVSVADKAKSDGSELWPDLDVACGLLRKSSKSPKKALLESFRLPPRQARYVCWIASYRGVGCTGVDFSKWLGGLNPKFFFHTMAYSREKAHVVTDSDFCWSFLGAIECP